MRKLTESDYRISDWSGGKTVQIAIAPEDAQYANRAFLWRLSSATVDLDESDFTSLPDYMRLIAPLRGEMRLTHNGSEAIDLAPYEVHRFDGADATHSWGRCTDFNLMLRKGACDGSVTAVSGVQAEEKTFTPEPETETVIICCTEGGVNVSYGEDRVELAEKEAAQLQGGPIGPVSMSFPAGGCVMCAQVWRT